jgi:hypothetical protein
LILKLIAQALQWRSLNWLKHSPPEAERVRLKNSAGRLVHLKFVNKKLKNKIHKKTISHFSSRPQLLAKLAATIIYNKFGETCSQLQTKEYFKKAPALPHCRASTNKSRALSLRPSLPDAETDGRKRCRLARTRAHQNIFESGSQLGAATLDVTTLAVIAKLGRFTQ